MYHKLLYNCQLQLFVDTLILGYLLQIHVFFDSCNFGGFDPYVRMGSVLGSEKRTKEAPPVSDSQCFAKPTKPPPIPPRTSKYHK